MGANVTNGNAMDANRSDTTDQLLEATHKKYLMAYLPIIVLMCVTTTMGMVGNIFTLLFYCSQARKTSTIVFIIALASLDFIVCFMAITTIADMSVNVYFKGTFVCKSMYFFDHWTVVSSVLVLWIISIDRYRKICKPFAWQFKVRSAFKTVFILIGVSLGFAVPSFINYDILTVNLTAPDGDHVLGNYCTNTDKPELKAFVTFAHVFDGLMIIFVFVTFVVTYGQIWRVLRKHQKQIGKMISPVRASRELSSSERAIESNVSLNKSASCDSFDAKHRIGLSSISCQPSNSDVSPSSGNFLTVPHQNVESASSVGSIDQTRKKSDSRASPSRSERNITIMMLAVSVGYVACFTPYFIVSGIRVLTLAGEAEMEAWVQFMLRSPFYNSVINPIIFCFFNPQFRRYIKEAILGCRVRQYVFTSTSS